MYSAVIGGIGSANAYMQRTPEEQIRFECLAAALRIGHYDKHESVLDAARAFEAYLKGE
jgi:hypothetical protein